MTVDPPYEPLIAVDSVVSPRVEIHTPPAAILFPGIFKDESEPPDAVLGYAAGIIDGEGCISLSCDKRGCYQLQVHVSNTDIRLLAWLYRMFGGCSPRKKHKPRSSSHNQCFEWLLSGQKVLPLLKALQPYLLLKERQAELAIEFLERYSPGVSSRLSSEDQIYRHKIHEEIKSLNGRKIHE